MTNSFFSSTYLKIKEMRRHFLVHDEISKRIFKFENSLNGKYITSVNPSVYHSNMTFRFEPKNRLYKNDTNHLASASASTSNLASASTLDLPSILSDTRKSNDTMDDRSSTTKEPSNEYDRKLLRSFKDTEKDFRYIKKRYHEDSFYYPRSQMHSTMSEMLCWK